MTTRRAPRARRRALIAAIVVLAALVVGVGLSGTRGAAPWTDDGQTAVGHAASHRSAPPSTPPTLLAAGDIATCDGAADRTGALLAGIPGVVAPLGDLAYPDGSVDAFRSCFDPAWGTERDRTRPAMGNHDVRTRGAAGYFAYFGAAAGPRPHGVYSYDLGAWHVIVLNSNCDEVGGCDSSSPQGRWLRGDLAGVETGNILAYWHHPRFSTGVHGDDPDVDGFWQLLHAAGADVVLNGHDHDYQRWARIDPTGRPDPGGIREFVVGTGGADLRPFAEQAPPTLEYRQDTTHGILRLDLLACGYRWEFIGTDGGRVLDRGTAGGTCRD